MEVPKFSLKVADLYVYVLVLLHNPNISEIRKASQIFQILFNIQNWNSGRAVCYFDRFSFVPSICNTDPFSRAQPHV